MAKTPNKTEKLDAEPAPRKSSPEDSGKLQRQNADAKWLEDRRELVGYTQNKISYAIANHQQQWRRILDNSQPAKLSEAIRLAELLRVPLDVLIERLGYRVPKATVRVLGELNAQGRVSIYPPGRVETISAPPELADEAAAIVVRAPSSGLAIFDGNYLIYEPATGIVPGAFGRLAVIELGDHIAPIVGILDRAGRVGKGRIAIFGTGETIESERIISAAPVLWTKTG